MMLQSENFRRCIFTDTSEVPQCHEIDLLYYINSEKILKSIVVYAPVKTSLFASFFAGA